MNKENIQNQEGEQMENQQPTNMPENIQEPIIDSSREEQIINSTLLDGVIGFINFDNGSVDNTTSGAMVTAERRRLFRRDVYVGIKDNEQNLEFLGRIVEGPFHSPHEIGADSAITRTTVLHPERTKFRPSYFVYGTIEVLGQLVNGERLIPTPTRPRPYSEIFIFPPDRLKSLLEIDGDILIGHLMGYEEKKIEVKSNSNNKNFLPRNVGIFGTVGSGKSNTTQVLIEEAIQAGWAVVVIDVEGEYVRMNEPNDRVDMISILRSNFNLNPIGITDFQTFVPSSGDSEAENPIRFKVPISGLNNDVIFDIQEFSEPQQRMYERVVSFAIQRRRQTRQNSNLGALAPNTNKPFISALNQVKQNFPQEVELHEDLDNIIAKHSSNTTQTYTLQELIDILGHEDFLRTIQAFERNTASALRSKLFSIASSGMLDWNQNARISYLPVDSFLVGGRLSVVDVSETDDRSRNIAIAYILQCLFDKVIETPFGENIPGTSTPRPKVLVVIEEVHTFVSRQSVSKMRAVLDNLQTISRRGRKRWMSLALVSQQPGHVPDELFELANTRFIHQLKSATNLAPVKQTTGGVHEALWTNVPALGPGQCLLTGSVFKNPIFVNVRPARSKRLLTS
ncbi:ATP-binding protein [Tenuifilum osseticum]|uniref:ATP-binding protein n=1 Tax=Tenuifilum osseticum TaxID=3374723 RepID=UPI0034E50ED0